MKIRIVKRARPAQIERLVSQYGLHDYRRYRMLRKERIAAYACFQIRRFLAQRDAWVVAAGDDSSLLGLAVLQRLEWDTRCLGVPAARISLFMTACDSARASASAGAGLLAFLLRLSREKGIAFLSWRIDTDDTAAVGACQQHGFRLADTLVTYAFNRYKHAVPCVKALFRVRSAAAQDAERLASIAYHAFSKDRFHADPHLNAGRSDSLFAEWIRTACREKRLNRVFVAENRTGVAGFLSFKTDPHLARFSGYRIAGHGLSAVIPEAKGAYPCLVKAALDEIVERHDCLEFDTQLNNYEVLRVWQAFGFDFVRSKYTFHRWLRPPSP